jgi:hypothetical protein
MRVLLQTRLSAITASGWFSDLTQQAGECRKTVGRRPGLLSRRGVGCPRRSDSRSAIDIPIDFHGALLFNTTKWSKVSGTDSLMRRVLTCLSVAVLGLSGAPQSHAQQIKVMQYNVRGHLGLSPSNSTTEARALGRIVNYSRPDILLFNEIQGADIGVSSAGLVAWATNNCPYLGSVPSIPQLPNGAVSNATFWVSVCTKWDGHIRNAAISRFPISDEATYNTGLRGLHRFRVQMAGTNVLEVFHCHLEALGDGASCSNRQNEATQDATNIVQWANSNPTIPYIAAGDWNDDETHSQCTSIGGISGFYHPITTMREGGRLVEFKPSAINGDSDTISTPNPSSRFDYCLAASNRLSAVSGYVFNSNVWATNVVTSARYTNEVLGSTSCDNTEGSDHCPVFVVYSFPVEPPDFTLSPTDTVVSTGNQGGPFTPSSLMYTLSNTNATSLSWSVTNREPWLSVSATSGTLAAGDSTNITVTINSIANTRSPRTYIDLVTFQDTATGGSVSCEVDLSINISGYFDDFGAFSNGNLVGQQGWTLYDTSNSLPLQVSGGQVVIPYGQTADNQDAYKSFPTTHATTFWGAMLTVSNAPNSSTPAYFLATTPDNGTGTPKYRLTAKNSGAGYVLGGRITSGPFTFGSTPLTYGTPYRVIVECDSGGFVMKAFVNPTSTNLAAQTPYFTDNNGDCFGPTQNGALLISQFGNVSNPNVGLSIGNIVVANNFADAYSSLSSGLTVIPSTGFDASGDQGGPFTPDTQDYTLTNTGTGQIGWSASALSNWLDVSATSGTLSGGAGTNVTVTINANANALAGGLYSNIVSFVNTSNGVGTTNVAFSLLVRDGIPDDWRLQYFGHVDPRASDLSRAQDDPDGDGCNNLCEYQAGTDPTNGASYFRITSVTRQGSDLWLTWIAGLGRTNVVQATAGLPGGSYSTNNFSDISQWIVLPPGSGPTTTNFPDPSATTNSPARYYRIRLQP